MQEGRIDERSKESCDNQGAIFYIIPMGQPQEIAYSNKEQRIEG